MLTIKLTHFKGLRGVQVPTKNRRNTAIAAAIMAVAIGAFLLGNRTGQSRTR
jgi:hypothetical protein